MCEHSRRAVTSIDSVTPLLLETAVLPMSESRVRVVLLRIPAKLKATLTELAEREHRSLNKQIEFLLDRCIREEANSGTEESDRARSARGKRK
jgi:hypothetical protein